MIKDLDIKFDAIKSLNEGVFREPAIVASFENIDGDHLLDQFTADELITVLTNDEMIEHLESEGFTVQEE